MAATHLGSKPGHTEVSLLTPGKQSFLIFCKRYILILDIEARHEPVIPEAERLKWKVSSLRLEWDV